MFNEIKNSPEGSLFYGQYEYMDQARFNQLQGIEIIQNSKSKRRSSSQPQIIPPAAAGISIELEQTEEQQPPIQSNGRTEKFISQAEYALPKEENEQLRRNTEGYERWKQWLEEKLDKFESNSFAQNVQIMESVRAAVQESSTEIIQATTSIVQGSTAEVTTLMHTVTKEKGVLEQKCYDALKKAESKARSLAQTNKGVFTRKINALERKNQELAASLLGAQEQPQMLHVIADTVILAHWLGVPGYSQFPDFVKMINNYPLSAKPPNTRRRPDLPIMPFTLDTLLRYFNTLIPEARIKRANCTASVDKLRFALGLLAGPIYSERAFKKIQNALMQQINHLSGQLQIEEQDDMLVEYVPVDAPFFQTEVEETWRLSDVSPASRAKLATFKQNMDIVDEFDTFTYWKYFTFLHACGTRVFMSPEVHTANLRMMNGAFYNEATVKEMERPLMLSIEQLTKQLKNENPKEFLKNETLIGQIVESMKTKRESAHSTKPRNVPLTSEHMARRKTKSQQAAASSSADLDGA